MATRRPSVTSALLSGVLVVGAWGCSNDPAGSTPLDRATAAVLADAADRLADALAEGDACRATLEADALRERASRALEDGDAPESVVAETTRIADVATAELSCDLDEDAEIAAADEEEPEGGEEDAEADDQDDTSDADQEADTANRDTSPETTPMDAEEDQDDDGPQGKAKGHDRNGPPSDRGKGRGNG